MMNSGRLVEANNFFEHESIEFKQEMEIEALLVDIACEFINYRDRNGLTQKDLAAKLDLFTGLKGISENEQDMFIQNIIKSLGY